MGRTKPIVSAEYVVGITDGEGCFYVNLSKSPAYKSGWRVQMHFHLKLQETDEEILWKIRNTLNCGNVYFQKEQRKNHTQCYRYTVSAWKDIESTLIPFFKKHQLQTASKRKNFTLFCQIADLVSQGKHLTPKGIEKIRTLKQSMNKRTIGLA
ncbi:LAGLIDADG family homing endonuclease [Candidatus Kaiserbacteria bacterium]|nr:MAG: LAGLIDADG family homing endonuclease [Candidatus Kaiserbacteria bacterium]